MIKAKEIEKANDEFHQPFLHIKKKARQIQENYLNFTKLFIDNFKLLAFIALKF